MPFRDRHTFRQMRSTTTAVSGDTTAPVISNIVESGITTTTATIAWDVDEPATGQIFYGTTLGVYDKESLHEPTLLTFHRQTLTGLTAGTTYYYLITSIDAANNIGTSEGEFDTTGSAPTTGTVYGVAIAADSKADRPVRWDWKVSYRFKATQTSNITGIAWQSRTQDPSYSLGNSVVRIAIRTNTAGTGFPTSTELGAVVVNIAKHNTGVVQIDTFPTSIPVVAGTIYHIVWTQWAAGFEVDNSTTNNNWSSVNNIYSFESVSRPQPDPRWGGDYAVLTGGSPTRPWQVEQGYTADVDIIYSNGAHDGQRYLEAMDDVASPFVRTTISGTNEMARQSFTPTSNIDTAEAWVYIRRVSGTGDLTVGLYDSGMSLIEAQSITGSTIGGRSVSPTIYQYANGRWYGVTWSTTRTLSSGSTYYLRFSAPAGTTYHLSGMRHYDNWQASPIMQSWYFNEGSPSRTSNGGSTWTPPYVNPQVDYPCYFVLA